MQRLKLPILLTFLLLLGLGVALGEPKEIFRNAIIVCLSCIGIQ